MNRSRRCHPTDLTMFLAGSNKLHGTVPGEVIGNLRLLKELELGGNHFTGQLPSQIGLCTNLTSLLVDETGLSGSIPSELLSLSNLELFTLSNSSLTGSIPDMFCEAVKHPSTQCEPWAKRRGLCDDPSQYSKCEGTTLCGCDCGECRNSSNVAGNDI